MVTLCDVVSWNDNYLKVDGMSGTYDCVYQSEGIYDTRVRLYENKNRDLIIVYRPTQQTYDGSQIHVQRELFPCRFINDSCHGFVNDRFQEAFLSLTTPQLMNQIKKAQTIIVAGHSLGGSFALFMGLFLTYSLEKEPHFILSLAGPFIGDIEFYSFYQEPLFQKIYMIESINEYDTNEYDGTIEGYNVDHSPLLYIDHSKICGILVPKLQNSYGMHDLTNYQGFFRGS